MKKCPVSTAPGQHEIYIKKLAYSYCSFSSDGSNKMAQIWNNLKLNNAKSITDVRASALEW